MQGRTDLLAQIQVAAQSHSWLARGLGGAVGHRSRPAAGEGRLDCEGGGLVRRRNVDHGQPLLRHVYFPDRLHVLDNAPTPRPGTPLPTVSPEGGVPEPARAGVVAGRLHGWFERHRLGGAVGGGFTQGRYLGLVRGQRPAELGGGPLGDVPAVHLGGRRQPLGGTPVGLRAIRAVPHVRDRTFREKPSTRQTHTGTSLIHSVIAVSERAPARTLAAAAATRADSR